MKPLAIANSKSAPPRGERVAWMQGVSRYFDRPAFLRALTNVSFEVRRGEVFGLLGPSGSGKSTTIRILAGRLPPSEGKARVLGRPPRRSAAGSRVGYVPQKWSHIKSHRWAEAVDFLRDLFIWSKRPPRSRPDDTIPGKERCSVLKQTLLKNPELLLLDEPFAALDAAGCAEMRDLIVALARRGKTVILTSNSLIHTKDVCDRFAVCHAGRIESLGTLDEILAATDTIRTLGPLLPPEAAQRVLRTIREDLNRPASATEPLIPGPPGDSPAAAPAALAEEAPVAATANEVLAPLVGITGATSNALRGQSASPLNNDRLAALTKPPPTAAPPPPENPG